jgi:ribosomal protein S17
MDKRTTISYNLLQYVTQYGQNDFMSKKIHNVNNIVRNGDLISNKLTRNLRCSHKVTVVYLKILLDWPDDDQRVETIFAAITARSFVYL